jgi:hypothetical protein
MAFRLGWSSQPDGNFDFESGSRNSPFEVEGYEVEVGFMVKKVKRKYFCFYKKKIFLFKENSNRSLATAPGSLLVILNTNRKIPQVHGITIVAFTCKYSRYRIFHREWRYFF